MSSAYQNPLDGWPLRAEGDSLVDDKGVRFPIIAGIPRFCEAENYASSFGRQWNLLRSTQIDRDAGEEKPSKLRLFAETGWTPEELAGLDVLEVGSGAGRFSRGAPHIHTRANLYSVDYSSAVEANWANNGDIAPGRFHLSQASIYEMPFPDDRFDKVLCLGVLQHTPDFEASVRSLVAKAKQGGEIIVDFYSIRGFSTKFTPNTAPPFHNTDEPGKAAGADRAACRLADCRLPFPAA